MQTYGQRTGKVIYPERRTRGWAGGRRLQHNATMAERMRVRRKPKKAERQLAKKELKQEYGG